MAIDEQKRRKIDSIAGLQTKNREIYPTLATESQEKMEAQDVKILRFR